MLRARSKESFERTIGDHIRSKYIRPCLANENGLILDVGSGLVPKGDVNVDINRKWEVYLTRINKPAPNFVVADAIALPFKESSFSVIVGSDVLEHIENDELALSEMRRVLKQGGKAVIHVPNKDQKHILQFKGTIIVRNGKGEKQTLTWGEEQKEHKRTGYSDIELREKLVNVGFSEISISETFNIIECLAWEWDRFVVYESLCVGKDPAKADVLPIRSKSFTLIMSQMMQAKPQEFRHLGWLVEAK